MFRGTGGLINYVYNINGNLVKDANKNISGIAYNLLNLPRLINVTGKGMISYHYDAAGNKLSKAVNETGQGQKITTYLGEWSLKMMYCSMWRWKRAGSDQTVQPSQRIIS